MKKVLIFEDDIYLARALKKTLGAKGFEVETILSLPTSIEAEGFQEVLNRSSGFSLIVWDGDMQGIYTFRGYIQEFAKVFKGPMIAHSGSTQGREFQMSAGCTHELPKDYDDLLVLIGELLN